MPQGVTGHFPRRTKLQRVLHRVPALPAVLTDVRRLSSDFHQVLAEHAVSREYLGHPVGKREAAVASPCLPVWEDRIRAVMFASFVDQLRSPRWSHASSSAVPRSFGAACSVESSPGSHTLMWVYLLLSTSARSSNGGDATKTVVDAWDTVRYPLTILMAATLCSLLRSRMLRRLAIISSAYTGSPYITRNRTTPSYSRRTTSPALPMFGSRPHKVLAAADTFGIRESKCGSNIHWPSMTRPRYFIHNPTPTVSLAMFMLRPGGGVPRLFLS